MEAKRVEEALLDVSNFVLIAAQPLQIALGPFVHPRALRGQIEEQDTILSLCIVRGNVSLPDRVLEASYQDFLKFRMSGFF